MDCAVVESGPWKYKVAHCCSRPKGAFFSVPWSGSEIRDDWTPGFHQTRVHQKLRSPECGVHRRLPLFWTRRPTSSAAMPHLPPSSHVPHHTCPQQQFAGEGERPGSWRQHLGEPGAQVTCCPDPRNPIAGAAADRKVAAPPEERRDLRNSIVTAIQN